jgi:uncharacterized membrane protein
MATGAAPAVRSQTKVLFFLLFFATTIVVMYLKDGRIFDPASPIAQHFAPVKGYLAIHAFFGILAMVVAAFQFSNRLRARYITIHRALGYTYVVSVFIAAPLASVVAFKLALLPLKVANTMQSFAWIVTTSIALYCVRSGNIVQHRRWMIRSYPFAMVFTVVRAIQAIPAIARLGYPGREAVVWSVIALAAFLPNIFLEWRSIFPRAGERKPAATQ